MRSAAPVTQNHLSKPEDLMLQNATPLRNQRPDLLTSLMNMSLVVRPPREMHLSRSSSNVLCLPTLLKLLQYPHVLLTFGKVQGLIWKCASRHNCVHFFDIWTSKSAPNVRCFVGFDLETCFAPQPRALFQHLNFQKCSELFSFLHFWLRHVLRATTACTFSTCQLPKVLREWCALDILISKCASRRNGVQLFISYLATWLRTRRFSQPTFRPSRATNH